MPSIRTPAVSGTFYPGDPAVLRQTISDFLGEAQGDAEPPKALIAPHAGYIYSGPVAASAYARLSKHAKTIKRVVLLGPSHRVGFYGIAAPIVDYFETPLGRVRVEQSVIDPLLALPWMQRSDQPHALEHSLEVHLPFLQTVIDDFVLVPLVVGDARPAQVAEILERLWGGPETLIVISSDLSHYLTYDEARKIDSVTTKAIEALREGDINFDQACGALPVRGLLLAAKQHSMHCETVDLRNSGDTAGPRDHVVGYGAYVFS